MASPKWYHVVGAKKKRSKDQLINSMLVFAKVMSSILAGLPQDRRRTEALELDVARLIDKQGEDSAAISRLGRRVSHLEVSDDEAHQYNRKGCLILSSPTWKDEGGRVVKKSLILPDNELDTDLETHALDLVKQKYDVQIDEADLQAWVHTHQVLEQVQRIFLV